MNITSTREGMARFRRLNATRIIATTLGVIFGLSGVNHGFFEALQGNKPADGLLIHAIGEAQRFWSLGTEDAFTVVPNYLVTGLSSIAVGLAIIVWSLRFLPTRHGPTVFLLLFILLFLVGGGIAQVVFFIPAWAFATRINKPLTTWSRVLPRSARPFLSRLWPVTLALSTASILISIAVAVFGWIPGITDPQRILNIVLSLVMVSAVLNVVSFIAGFGHDLMRMEATARTGARTQGANSAGP